MPIDKEGLGQAFTRGLMVAMSGSAAIRPEINEASNYAALGAANTYEDFSTRTADIEALAKAGDIEGVTAGLLGLQNAMSGGAGVSTMSDDLRKLLAELSEAGIKTAELEALWNGSARAEAVKRQSDQVILAYRQEAELAFASNQFGANSLELEKLRGRQARENLAIRLEEIGVQQGSLQWAEAHLALATRQAQSEEANRQARREWVQDEEDGIAAINREIALIGVSNAERIRANAIAQVDIEIRKRKLQGMEAEEARALAIAKAEAEILRLRKESLREVLISSMMDIYDARLAEEHDIAIRAAIEAEKAYARVLMDTGDAEAAKAEAERVRQKVLRDAEIEKRKALQDIATAGLMDVYDARLARERDPYIRAAIEAEKEYASVLAATKDADRAAAAAARVRARALSEVDLEQANFLRGQAETIAQQRLELALMGQTAQVRARVLAMVQAERDIQRLGLQGGAADRARQAALSQAEMTRQIEASADAWERVQSAGENAIDAILDNLKAGDISGAFEELAAEIEKGLFDLAIRNPLKNALMGTDLGTMEDVGGLSGIWGRLTGKNQVDEAALVSNAMTAVNTMSVMATSVTIGGAGAMSFLSGSAANMSGAPGGWGGSLTGSGDVQAQMWSFFAGKGLKPHQIAGIMGNAHAESAFNPLAVGDNGTSFGLFQHHKGRADGLLAATGGKAGLGDINAQLEYVWKELLTTESAAMQKLMASGNVQQATAAFAGFERPQGWSAANPTGAHNWDGRLGAAEAALAKFGTTATDATANLGTLGTGFDAFGNALVSGVNGLASGGAQGGIMGFLGTLAGGIASALGLPGFAMGGDHAGGWRMVGEKGPELEATGAARYFNASQTREILTGRAPVMAANNNAPAVVQINQTFEDRSSGGMKVETVESTDARGQRQQRFIFSDAVAEGISTPGGRGGQELQRGFGLRPPATRRG